MMALYIALSAGLSRPYWAMAAVYVVANPLSGATRSKAVYRVLGTMIGAAGSVFLLPLFVNAPELFSLVVALWTGGFLFISFLDRTPRRSSCRG
ncbi:MAG: FUSC family protein, partial [Hyphomicrobiales bacterium]